MWTCKRLVLPAKEFTKAEIRNCWSRHTEKNWQSQWAVGTSCQNMESWGLCTRCSKVQLTSETEERADFVFSNNSTNKTLQFLLSRKGTTEDGEMCIVSMVSHLLSRSSTPLSALSHLPFQAEKPGSDVFFKEHRHYEGSWTCKRPKPCTQDCCPLSPYGNGNVHAHISYSLHATDNCW